MEPSEKRNVRDQLRAVERQLRLWDPIGVILNPDDPTNPLDEYDSYAPQVLALLRQGVRVEALAEHLNRIANSRMGLSRALDRDREFAETLLHWWQSRERKQDAV